MAPTAAAQDTVSPAVATPEWLALGIEQRSRIEVMSHPFRIDEPGLTRLLALRTRLQLEVREILDPLRFVLELQDARGMLNDAPLTAPARHVNELDLLQIHFSLVWDRIPGAAVPTALQIGRFTMDLGRRRLVARNRMRNTTNAFDGLLWQLGSDARWMLHAFVTRPVLLEPEALDTSTPERHFWGAYFHNRTFGAINVDLYYLGLREDERTTTARTLSTVGARLFAAQAPGRVDYEIESAWQSGRTAGRDHRGHFQHGELGYTLKSAWASRFSLHYDYASGDRDPADERLDRFDTLFGARRFELMPTGIYGPFTRSNLHTPGMRWGAAPGPGVSLFAACRGVWLAQARDAWVASGLQDTTGAAGSYLGTHLEGAARLQPWRVLAIELGYARFFKGSYLARVPGSTGLADSDFFYAELDLRAALLP